MLPHLSLKSRTSCAYAKANGCAKGPQALGRKAQDQTLSGGFKPCWGYDYHTISGILGHLRSCHALLASLASQSSPLLRLLSVLDQQLSRHCKGRLQS